MARRIRDIDPTSTLQQKWNPDDFASSAVSDLRPSADELLDEGSVLGQRTRRPGFVFLPPGARLEIMPLRRESWICLNPSIRLH